MMLQNIPIETENELGAVVMGTVSPWRSTFPAAAKYVPYINAVEKQYKIPPNLLVAMAEKESGFNPKARGAKLDGGQQAWGMFQILMPLHKGEVNPDDWQAAAVWAAKYLKQALKLTAVDGKKSWPRAIAAYHTGPGAVGGWVKKHGDRWTSKLGVYGNDYLKYMAARVFHVINAPAEWPYA